MARYYFFLLASRSTAPFRVLLSFCASCQRSSRAAAAAAAHAAAAAAAAAIPGRCRGVLRGRAASAICNLVHLQSGPLPIVNVCAWFLPGRPQRGACGGAWREKERRRRQAAPALRLELLSQQQRARCARSPTGPSMHPPHPRPPLADRRAPADTAAPCALSLGRCVVCVCALLLRCDYDACFSLLRRGRAWYAGPVPLQTGLSFAPPSRDHSLFGRPIDTGAAAPPHGPALYSTVTATGVVSLPSVGPALFEKKP